jgi:uncharacterized membrane protein YdjX (TVP38/TMEM64 family)
MASHVLSVAGALFGVVVGFTVSITLSIVGSIILYEISRVCRLQHVHSYGYMSFRP